MHYFAYSIKMIQYFPMGFKGMMVGGGSKRLYYKAQVTLFDNIAQQIIRYGYVNESARRLLASNLN